jgi:plastocyanin
VTPDFSQTPTSTVTPTPTPQPASCISSPLTINVESEYDTNTNTTVVKYITSDSNTNGGLFGCIDVNRGSTVTISVTGSAPDVESHPIKITNFNGQGQHGTPLSNVVSTWNAGAPYTLTWEVPCNEEINQYQYQCENHASMRGVINVNGTCPTPTPTPTPTLTQTQTPTSTATPTITVTPSITPSVAAQGCDTLPAELPMTLCDD